MEVFHSARLYCVRIMWKKTRVEAKTKVECNNIRSTLCSAESSRDKREETKKKVKYTVVRLCSTTKQSEAKRRVWYRV